MQVTQHDSLARFAPQAEGLPAGPVALIAAEDGCEIASTLAHHADLGFAAIVLLAPPELAPPTNADADAAACPVHLVRHPVRQPGALGAAVNRLIAALAGRWLYLGYNAEYLFFPFCENRSIGEMLTFHEGERRAAMLACVVDLYAPDLALCPDGVSRKEARFDAAGYFALARPDPEEPSATLDRQHDIYGGLRLRFEEHIPDGRLRIDRIALFRAEKGLTWRDDHTLSAPEMNTISCPWHRNLTASVASFRAARALRLNPESRAAISGFMWPRAQRFEWASRQLLEAGLMEPGQWA